MRETSTEPFEKFLSAYASATSSSVVKPTTGDSIDGYVDPRLFVVPIPVSEHNLLFLIYMIQANHIRTNVSVPTSASEVKLHWSYGTIAQTLKLE